MFVSVGAPSIMPQLFAEQPRALPWLPDKLFSSGRARWQGLVAQKLISKSVPQQRIRGVVIFSGCPWWLRPFSEVPAASDQGAGIWRTKVVQPTAPPDSPSAACMEINARTMELAGAAREPPGTATLAT